MTLQMLRCFDAVARTLNFAEAAEELYITQPAVTHQIQELEAELGVRLFDRSKHRVSLTASGISFHNDVSDILDRINIAVDDVRSSGNSSEPLHVGCQSTLQLDFLPDIYRTYSKAFPDVFINSLELNVVHGKAEFPDQLDAAFVTKDCVPAQKDLQYASLFKGTFCCILPKGHRLGNFPSLSAEDLSGEVLVLLETSCCPPQMNQLQTELRRKLPESKLFLSSSSLYTALMIEAGLGIAVMPDFVCPTSANVQKIPFETDLIPEYGIAWKNHSKQPKIKKFVDAALLTRGILPHYHP